MFQLAILRKPVDGTEIQDQQLTIDGYPVNYFARIKELEKGDLIIYYTELGKKIYEVEMVTIIRDVDWSYLEKTEENKITLITCVEDEPELRRCIQGKER